MVILDELVEEMHHEIKEAAQEVGDLGTKNRAAIFGFLFLKPKYIYFRTFTANHSTVGGDADLEEGNRFGVISYCFSRRDKCCQLYV